MDTGLRAHGADGPRRLAWHLDIPTSTRGALSSLGYRGADVCASPGLRNFSLETIFSVTYISLTTAGVHGEQAFVDSWTLVRVGEGRGGGAGRGGGGGGAVQMPGCWPRVPGAGHLYSSCSPAGTGTSVTLPSPSSWEKWPWRGFGTSLDQNKRRPAVRSPPSPIQPVPRLRFLEKQLPLGLVSQGC